MKPNERLRSFRQSPAALLSEAERHFRAAAERDPAFAEARVRLGRVMTLRGQTAKAASELVRAIGLASDNEVKYYIQRYSVVLPMVLRCSSCSW